MSKIINIGRNASATLLALMIIATPFASVQAADLYTGYSYDYFVPDSSSSYSYDYYVPSSSSSYSYDYFVPNYSSSYSYDYFVPDYSSSYSYDYFVPDYSSSYSYDYFVPNYSSSYSYDYFVPDSGCKHNCGGSYTPPPSGCKKNCNPPAPKPAPTCVISINPSHVSYGDSATITWSSNNASSATLTDFGSVSVNGSRHLSHVTTNRTYTLTVTGNGKTATCQASIKVEKEREDLQCKLKVSKSRIERGDSVKLTWSSEGANYGYITPDVGDVGKNGSETLRPRSTTTYKGTFYNHKGDKVTCSAKVTVEEYPVYYPPQTPHITLSAVPYTGFELGPFGTALYWTLLVLWCLFAAYLVAVKKAHVALASRLNKFLFGTGEVKTSAAAPVARPVAHTATAHPAHIDMTDEFVLSQLNRGRHAH